MTKLRFELRQDHAVLTGQEETGAFLRIPPSYCGVPVTRIEEFAFDGNKQLRFLQLPPSIREIGTAAFRGCEALQCVTIEDIGQFSLPDTPAAQWICTQGGYVSFLPPALEEIGPEAFRATGLQRISFSGEALRVGASAFQLCRDLREVRLLCKEVHIMHHGFAACTRLEQFCAPHAHCTLEQFAFGNCQNLEFFYAKDPPAYTSDSFFSCSRIQSLRQYSDGRFTIDPRTLYQETSPGSANPLVFQLRFITCALTLDPNDPDLQNTRHMLLSKLREEGLSPFHDDPEATLTQEE